MAENAEPLSLVSVIGAIGLLTSWGLASKITLGGHSGGGSRGRGVGD